MLLINCTVCYMCCVHNISSTISADGLTLFIQILLLFPYNLLVIIMWHKIDMQWTCYGSPVAVHLLMFQCVFK